MTSEVRTVSYADSVEWEPYATSASFGDDDVRPEVLWLHPPAADGSGPRVGYYRSDPATVRSAPKQAQYLHLLEGSMVIDWDEGGQTTLRPGDNLFMPAGAGYVCTYREPVVEYLVRL